MALTHNRFDQAQTMILKKFLFSSPVERAGPAWRLVTQMGDTSSKQSLKFVASPYEHEKHNAS